MPGVLPPKSPKVKTFKLWPPPDPLSIWWSGPCSFLGLTQAILLSFVAVASETKDNLSRDAKIASIALSELQKAIRFFRLYPQSHPFCS